MQGLFFLFFFRLFILINLVYFYLIPIHVYTGKGFGNHTFQVHNIHILKCTSFFVT